MRTTKLVWVTSFLLSLTACSSSGGGESDATVVAEGGMVLWACQNPGEACNPHDNCAINPICGDDRYCHPQRYQSCDDGLDCTTDSCAGQGLCRHEPQAGMCLVLVPGDSAASCVPEGTVHSENPCRVCNPSVDATRWSARNGGECDDGDPCTKDDTCREGICRGTFFGNQCTDNLTCTEDVCNADGSCHNPLLAGTCLIDGVCYDEGGRDADGCRRCDPSVDAYAWTALPSSCRIGSRCYAAGELDASGCGICDPDTSESAWSRTPETCLVDGACFKSGEEDLSGCGVCDPAQSSDSLSTASGTCRINGACYQSSDRSPSSCGICQPSGSTSSSTRWSVPSGAASQAWSFASDLEGFTPTPAGATVGWRHLAGDGHDAQGCLYYGNASGSGYDDGAANGGQIALPSVTLPAGQHAALHFWLYLDTEMSEEFDSLQLHLDGQLIWSKNARTVPVDHYRRWVQIEVDLSAHAGKTATLSFAFATGDAFSNSGRGVLIDDVAVITSCGAL